MDEFDDWIDLDEDDCEPVGSCDECGANLYADDLDAVCDSCSWWIAAANGDER